MDFQETSELMKYYEANPNRELPKKIQEIPAGKLNAIGYRERRNFDFESDIKQCFNCVHSIRAEENCEKEICRKWNMIVGEDDICNSFDQHPLWAWNMSEEDRVRRKEKIKKLKSVQTQEGCYIATAVYGDYDAAEVLVLRTFRDNVLKKTFAGRTFIKVYYAISPTFSKKLRHHSFINKIVKNLLDRWVHYLEKL